MLNYGKITLIKVKMVEGLQNWMHNASQLLSFYCSQNCIELEIFVRQVPLSAEKFSNFILFFSVGPDDIRLYQTWHRHNEKSN